jgi:outer membrane murein-binding lipoprotein Lpp
MPDKASEQLKQELASERERLGSAVDDLRGEVDALKRKLPYMAAAAIAAGILLGVVRRLLR